MDETTCMIEQYISALEAETFKVQLKNRTTGEGFWVDYNIPQLRKAIQFLRFKNANGFDVYARPKGYQYVLLDDLTRDVLTELATLKPCLLIETSPNNFQAWLTLRDIPNDRATAKSICKELAIRFGADLASAEPDHVGRLPGYTNRKEKYRQSNGHFPIVKLQRAANRLSTFYPGGAVPNEIQRDPLSIVHHQTTAISNGTQSEQDFGIACGLIRLGKTDEQIMIHILTVSPNLQHRKGRNVESYITRTIANARKQM